VWSGDRDPGQARGRLPVWGTREYAARRTRQGRSTAETIRCLKRYVAREVYCCLTVPPVTDPDSVPERSQA
jgi:hypothetical protein